MPCTCIWHSLVDRLVEVKVHWIPSSVWSKTSFSENTKRKFLPAFWNNRVSFLKYLSILLYSLSARRLGTSLCDSRSHLCQFISIHLSRLTDYWSRNRSDCFSSGNIFPLWKIIAKCFTTISFLLQTNFWFLINIEDNLMAIKSACLCVCVYFVAEIEIKKVLHFGCLRLWSVVFSHKLRNYF